MNIKVCQIASFEVANSYSPQRLTPSIIMIIGHFAFTLSSLLILLTTHFSPILFPPREALEHCIMETFQTTYFKTLSFWALFITPFVRLFTRLFVNLFVMNIAKLSRNPARISVAQWILSNLGIDWASRDYKGHMFWINESLMGRFHYVSTQRAVQGRFLPRIMRLTRHLSYGLWSGIVLWSRSW